MSVKLLDTIGLEPLAPESDQHTVRARDGVALATDVYLPAGAGKLPAILVRTCYDKASDYTALKHIAPLFVENGYAFVAQDVRGKARSDGETDAYTYEMLDAYDTIDWIVEQPWSNGAVGLTGASYYGFTAWAGVASGHRAIRAAIPQVTGIDMGANHVGSRWQQEPPNLIGLNDLVQIWTNRESYLFDIDYSADSVSSLLQQVESIVGKSTSVGALLARAKSGEYYQPYGNRHPYHTTNVPILHWVNWYDPGLAPSGMRDWRHFRSLPSTRHLHYLRAASADHAMVRLQDVETGISGIDNIPDEVWTDILVSDIGDQLAFFDEHLKNNAPAEVTARARWHVGHNGWHSSDEWTPEEVELTRLYLTASNPNGGALADDADSQPQQLRWTHDPDNPVPASTSIEEIWYFLAEYPDERMLKDRHDVLTFTGDPLAGPLTIAGQPVITGEFGSTAPSSHVFATLQDVAPDGTTRPISMGMASAASGATEPLRLALSDIAYEFRPDHSVQLQIRSSCFPWFLVHPGTDENPWFAERTAITISTLRVGGSSPASLTLPVLG
jgi:predicted acyl esterase